jgi:large subunit ribosomal protein L17
MLRSMATSLFMHDEIMTTLARAKALKEQADHIVTLAKRGDVHAMRQVLRLIYNQSTGELIKDEKTGKDMDETVLRRIFRNVAPRFKERKGGYTRVIQAAPRRGDNAPMALVQLVD